MKCPIILRKCALADQFESRIFIGRGVIEKFRLINNENDC